MKGIAAFTALILAALVLEAHGETIQELKKIVDTFMACKEKHHLTEEELSSFTERALDYPYQMSHQAKCIIPCMLGALGIVKDDKFDAEAAYQFVEILHLDDKKLVEETKKHIATCYNTVPKNDDICEYTYSMLQCWRNQNKMDNLV